MQHITSGHAPYSASTEEHPKQSAPLINILQHASKHHAYMFVCAPLTDTETMLLLSSACVAWISQILTTSKVRQKAGWKKGSMLFTTVSVFSEMRKVGADQ